MRGACRLAQDVPHWRELIGSSIVADSHGRMFDLSLLRLEDTYREENRISYHFREGGPDDVLEDIVRVFSPQKGVRIHIWALKTTRAVDSVCRMVDIDATDLAKTSYMMRALATLGAASVQDLSVKA